nr:uncharacterized protein LOC127305184 isoform X2 [Lolium perenne]
MSPPRSSSPQRGPPPCALFWPERRWSPPLHEPPRPATSSSHVSASSARPFCARPPPPHALLRLVCHVRAAMASPSPTSPTDAMASPSPTSPTAAASSCTCRRFLALLLYLTVFLHKHVLDHQRLCLRVSDSALTMRLSAASLLCRRCSQSEQYHASTAMYDAAPLPCNSNSNLVFEDANLATSPSSAANASPPSLHPGGPACEP